jgi:hypothetical protein
MIDCNLIAYYLPEEILPYKQYQSGVKEDRKAIFENDIKADENPELILAQDIVLPSGLGLSRGFYIVTLSDDFDFLLIYSTGKLIAKVPIIELGAIDASPKKSFKKQRNWMFWHKKDHLGESSEDFIHKLCEIKFDPKTNSYMLFWERGNTRALGVINIGD